MSMSYLQPIVIFLLVLLPATITGFHTFADVRRNRRAIPDAA
jgi:hypothetical protein